jgi:hypothetical protein
VVTLLISLKIWQTSGPTRRVLGLRFGNRLDEM